MLYPVQMVFDNARDFPLTKIYLNRKGNGTMQDLGKYCAENILVSGLNGSGKSTMAAVFMVVLNSKESEADPVSLMSSNYEYDIEHPWEFKGKILFFNDGTTEDAAPLVEVSAFIRGVTDKRTQSNRIIYKYFTIKEANTLEELPSTNIVVNYCADKDERKAEPLKNFNKKLEQYGVSPEKFLLYWRQGETNKLTLIKETERFEKFAKMMGLESEIKNYETLVVSQKNLHKELESTEIACGRLRNQLGALKNEAEKKNTRDDQLKTNISKALALINPLIQYNERETTRLKELIALCENNLLQLRPEYELAKQTLSDYRQKQANHREVQKVYQERRIQNQERETDIRQEMKEIESFVKENKTEFEAIEAFIRQLDSEGFADGTKILERIQELQKQFEAKRLLRQDKQAELDAKKSDKSIAVINLEHIEKQTEDLDDEIKRANQILWDNPKSQVSLKLTNVQAEMTQFEKELNEFSNEKKRLEDILIRDKKSFEPVVKSLSSSLKSLEQEIVKSRGSIQALDGETEDSRQEHRDNSKYLAGPKFKDLELSLVNSERDLEETERTKDNLEIQVTEQKNKLSDIFASIHYHVNTLNEEQSAENKKQTECETLIGVNKDEAQNKRQELLGIQEKIRLFPMKLEEYLSLLQDLQSQGQDYKNKIGSSIHQAVHLIEEMSRSLKEEKDVEQKKHEESKKYLGNIVGSLETTIQTITRQVQDSEKEVSGIEGQIKQNENNRSANLSKQSEVQKNIEGIPLTVEGYDKEIESSQIKERELAVSIEQNNTLIGQLNEELSHVVEGVIDTSQREAIDKQTELAYGFQEVFEFGDTDLSIALQKEKQLSVIRHTVFAESKRENLFPYSQHYHVPLLEYSDKVTNEPIPFGLRVKEGISRNISNRAVNWLKGIFSLINDTGVLEDKIGLRGYDPNNVGYFLSRAALEWHKKTLTERIQETENNLAESTNLLTMQEKNSAQFRASKNALVGHYNELKRLKLSFAEYESAIQKLTEEWEKLVNQTEEFVGSLNRLTHLRHFVEPFLSELRTPKYEKFDVEYLLSQTENIEAEVQNYRDTKNRLQEIAGFLDKVENQFRGTWARNQQRYQAFLQGSGEAVVLNHQVLSFSGFKDSLEATENEITELDSSLSGVENRTIETFEEKERLENLLANLKQIKTDIAVRESEIAKNVEKLKYSSEQIQKIASQLKTLSSLQKVGRDFSEVEPKQTATRNYLLESHVSLKKDYANYERDSKSYESLNITFEKMKNEILDIVGRIAERAILIETQSSLEEQIVAAGELLNEERSKLNRMVDRQQSMNGKLESLQEGKINFDRWFAELGSVYAEDVVLLAIEELLSRTPLITENALKWNEFKQGIVNNTSRLQDKRPEYDRLTGLISLVECAENSIAKKPLLMELQNKRQMQRQDIELLKQGITRIETKISDYDEEIINLENQEKYFAQYLNQHDNINWELHNLYKRNDLRYKILEVEKNTLNDEFRKITDGDAEIQKQINQIEQECIPLEQQISELEKSIGEKTDSITGATDSQNSLQKDILPLLTKEEEYQNILKPYDVKMSLGDFALALRTMYSYALCQAIEDEHMPSYDDFIKPLEIKECVINDEREYSINIDKVKDCITDGIRKTLSTKVVEKSEHDYHLEEKRLEKMEEDKQRLEAEVERIDIQEKEAHARVEGNIQTRVRKVETKLKQDLAQLGYQIELRYQYEPEQNGQKRRKLLLKFKTSTQKVFRVVDDRDGISGGEHAVVSLVMMAAILTVNEEISSAHSKTRAESGGYLLLDEWDAALDHINSFTVFQILKRLNKKIISVTPKTNSQSYLEEFGLVLKVLGMTQVAILENRKDIDIMFNELKNQEKK